MAKIDLVDISIRDGNQSLWGATGLNTAQIVQIAPVMDRVGFRALDFNSSTHMAMAVRYKQENPLGPHPPHPCGGAQHAAAIHHDGIPLHLLETADPDFMRLVYRSIARAGIGRVIVLDPMHDLDGLLTSAQMAKEEGIADVMAALTYTVSAVHDDAFYAGIARAAAACPYVDRVYIKDPAGILLPDRARTLVLAVKAVMGDKPLEIHAHCTIGLAPLAYMVAAEHGVDAVHTGAGALANGTSLPSASRTVSNLREMGHSVDIDDRSLALVESYFTRLADAEGLPKGTPQEFDAAYLRHQMPGGALTTLERQLKELGQEDRLAAVIEEVPRVRAELGYPIMVTPFPQIVSTQALFNVIGAERYANVSDQVIRYVLGKFGRPTAPVDANVLDKILSKPRAKELMTEAPALNPKDLRKRFGPRMTDEEMLLRSVMPEDQVDAMLAKGPAKLGYNPDTRGLMDLLRDVTARSDVSELDVEKPGLRYRCVRADRWRRMAESKSNSARIAARLTRTKGFVLDMDGTLVLGDKRNKGLRALPGAVDFIAHLEARGTPYMLFTNGTVRPPSAYVGELKHAGFNRGGRAHHDAVDRGGAVFPRQGVQADPGAGRRGGERPARRCRPRNRPPAGAREYRRGLCRLVPRVRHGGYRSGLRGGVARRQAVRRVAGALFRLGRGTHARHIGRHRRRHRQDHRRAHAGIGQAGARGDARGRAAPWRGCEGHLRHRRRSPSGDPDGGPRRRVRHRRHHRRRPGGRLQGRAEAQTRPSCGGEYRCRARSVARAFTLRRRGGSLRAAGRDAPSAGSDWRLRSRSAASRRGGARIPPGRTASSPSRPCPTGS